MKTLTHAPLSAFRSSSLLRLGINRNLTVFLLAVGLAASAVQAQLLETGELSPRQPSSAQKPLSVLKSIEKESAETLSAIASLAPMLGEAISDYRANPTKENGLALMKAQAKVAALGAPGCAKVSELARRVSGICAELSKRCANDAEGLMPAMETSARHAAEHKVSYDAGKDGLISLLKDLRSRGITNEAGMTHTERLKIAELLSLTGAAEIANRFLKNDAEAAAQAAAHLRKLAKRFGQQKDRFASMADAHALVGKTFATIATSTSRTAETLAMANRYKEENENSERIVGHLEKAHRDILATLTDMPVADINGFLTEATETPASVSTGLLARVMRFVGWED